MYLTRFGGQFIRVQSPFRVYLTHFGASEPSTFVFRSQSSFTMYLSSFGGQFIRVQSPFRV